MTPVILNNGDYMTNPLCEVLYFLHILQLFATLLTFLFLETLAVPTDDLYFSFRPIKFRGLGVIGIDLSPLLYSGWRGLPILIFNGLTGIVVLGPR